MKRNGIMVNIWNTCFFIAEWSKLFHFPPRFITVLKIKFYPLNEKKKCSNCTARRVSMTSSAISLEPRQIRRNHVTHHPTPPHHPLFAAWGWKQRAKVAGSTNSSTRSSWLPCCPRTPSTQRWTAASPPWRRTRWRTRTTPWSCSVSSPPHVIRVNDRGAFQTSFKLCKKKKWQAGVS